MQLQRQQVHTEQSEGGISGVSCRQVPQSALQYCWHQAEAGGRSSCSTSQYSTYLARQPAR
jgi:hypothetical protein